MLLFWTIFPALVTLTYGGRTLSVELLANFEQNLVDQFRDGIVNGSVANVDEFLGHDDLVRRQVADFANSFRRPDYVSKRMKRETSAGYYGALLDSSKYKIQKHMIF